MNKNTNKKGTSEKEDRTEAMLGTITDIWDTLAGMQDEEAQKSAYKQSIAEKFENDIAELNTILADDHEKQATKAEIAKLKKMLEAEAKHRIADLSK